MEEILGKLVQTPKICSAYLVGKDGLVIYKAGENILDEELLGVTGSEIYNIAEAGVEERFNMGELQIVTIESALGKLFLHKLNEMVFLTIYTNSDINLGLIRWLIQEAGRKLKDLI